MRPPSYYTSLANSNSIGNNRGGTSNSSQQLRSTFSSSSSSSYATRTHLPFVPQTMLVAHCYTGVGSSTKPYGQSSYDSPYSSSRYSSGSGSSSRSPGSYASSYTSSRPPSTKRHLPASSNYIPRSSYLSSASSISSSPSSGGGSSSNSYRRPSAYTYQPIKLRERPLLTRISNQIGSRYVDSSSSSRLARPPSGSDSAPSASTKKTGEERKNEESTAAKDEERDWSSDVARNISRNKYLIKFREFDKPRASIVPDREQVEVEQSRFETKEGPNISVTVKLPSQEAEETNGKEMRLLASSQVESEHEAVIESSKPEIGDKLTDVDGAKREECDTTTAGRNEEKEQVVAKKVKALKERRNIKLKIKNVAAPKLTDPNLVAPAKGDAEDATLEQPPREKKKKTQAVDQSQELLASKGATASVALPTTPTKSKVKRVAAKSSSSKTKSADELQQIDGAIKSELRAKDSLLTKKKSSDPSLRKVLAAKQLNRELAPAKAEVATEASSSDQLHESAKPQTDKRIRFREYNHDDFNFLSVLGHGGWGFVILAELKNHDACFAVKCIKKITIAEDDDFDSIMIERKVLTLGNIHPFICKLFCTFETAGYLFFAMEYCAGGDLMFHVQREGKFTEARSRFYAAEIICAIRFLHNQHIIYRDLKLDNILLDARGHVRLVDFGMCQCRTYREEMLPSNFCGTPEYISPEIIKGVPYNHSVDWWSFGVLLYEMAVGKMPFRGNDENELLWNVCYEQIHYPMFLTKELTSLLQLLLEREPSKRMGMSTCKAGDIYDQCWFKGVDWRAIEELRVPPPFVPDVTSERDVQNFDPDFTQSTPELSPVDEGTLKKIDQSQFQKFPYTNPNISIFG